MSLWQFRGRQECPPHTGFCFRWVARFLYAICPFIRLYRANAVSGK